MKRLSIVMSVFIALAVAAPSFAVDFDATGSLRFQGFYNDKASSDKDDKPDSYRDMRLRVRTELKVTDKITLVTRFDALEKVLSSKDSAIDAAEDDDNIDFDRAYMKIVSPIGLFVIGRQEGITWGTSWSDDEDDTDRIKYILPIPIGDNKLYIAAVAEKVGEYDKGIEKSDKDNDKYYLSGTYVAEKYKTGFLLGFYDFRTFQDPEQAAAYKALNDVGGLADGLKYVEYTELMLDAQLAADTATATLYDTLRTPYAGAGAAAAALKGIRGGSAAGKVWLLSPYFTGKFGDIGINTELDYVTGTIEYEGTAASVTPGGFTYAAPTAAADDRDVSAYSFFFETTYDSGPMGIQVGFATVSGDTDHSDGDIGSMGYVSPGVDWAKMFILSDDTHGMNTSLGGDLGNHVGDGFGTANKTLLAGYQMFYLGADYDVTETINIGTVMCMSKADDAPATFDDDQGFEIDLNFEWKIMDNLTYNSKIAYLAAGDYWKGANSNSLDGEDTIALYHKLEVTF